VPTGVEVLVDIACPSASTCYAVGYGATDGVVLTTTDDGSSWNLRALASTALLSGIACPSSTHCFAVGLSQQTLGDILSTSNGGATWVTESAPVTDELVQVACPSYVSNICYAVGFDGSNGTILRTINGGSTWARESMSSSVESVVNVACPSYVSNLCYAVGSSTSNTGVTLQTTDGVTWSTEILPKGIGDLSGVACPATPGSCLAVGKGEGPVGGLVLHNRGPFASSTVAPSVTPKSVTLGQEVTYTAKVMSSGGTPTGKVKFVVGSTVICGANLTNGVARCSSPSAPVGTDTIVATYGGSIVFAKSSGMTTLTVT
jgi:photosystem II stability/assembly factor-like uncharacterized protein